MSPKLAVAIEGGSRFPRVSGDEPISAFCAVIGERFSPRERG